MSCGVPRYPVLIYQNDQDSLHKWIQFNFRLPWGLPGILSWSTTWPSAVAILDWLQVSFSLLPSPSRDIRYYETKVQNVVISILLRVFSNENIIFGLKQCCQDFCLHWERVDLIKSSKKSKFLTSHKFDVWKPSSLLRQESTCLWVEGKSENVSDWSRGQEIKRNITKPFFVCI